MSQALRIRESALSVIEQANTSANSSRRITKKAAFTVVLRSLQTTSTLLRIIKLTLLLFLTQIYFQSHTHALLVNIH